MVAWTLPTNGGEALTVIACLLFGLVLPMSAAQILWVNLVTSATLGLVLAFEPSEPGVMRRAPRPPEAPLLSRFLVWRVVLVSALFAGPTQRYSDVSRKLDLPPGSIGPTRARTLRSLRRSLERDGLDGGSVA